MHRISPQALFVIDGSYLLYRSFYAIKPLHTSTGIPTNATFGFCRTIKKLLETFKPKRMVVVWDSKTKVWRHEVYEAYKATRQKAPSELQEHRQHIQEILDAMGMPQLSKEGYEGDDVIAALVKEHPKTPIVLVCADKDMFQLLSPHVLLFEPFKDRVIDEQAFAKERGFTANKAPFYYALLGDASDNVPGVAGVGEKTALELVQQFENLDDLYANVDKIPKATLQKKIVASRDDAYLSLKLVQLHPVATGKTLDDFTFTAEQWHNADQLFANLEFRSFMRTPRDHKAATLEHTKAEGWKCVIIKTEEQLKTLLKTLQHAKSFACDVETTGEHPLLTTLVGISFADDTKTGYYIPLAHKEDGQLATKKVLQALAPIMQKKGVDMSMHNGKFDQLVLIGQQLPTAPVTFDTMLAANLVKQEWQKNGLKDLSHYYLNEPMQRFDELVPKGKTIADISIDQAAHYGAHDSLQTYKLRPVLEEALEKAPALKKQFYEIEMPFYWVLLQMEAKGILLDPEKLAETKKELTQELHKIEQKMTAIVEHHTNQLFVAAFNFNSPKQLENLLFDILKLPTIKKNKGGGRSTDQEVLQALQDKHPLPALLLQYRELAKLLNTYVEPLPTMINPNTKRIHTSYSQTFVATGRLSSQQPNLQNIPAGSGPGAAIREAFVASRGYHLLSADYSQIELRILAHLTQDPVLLETFKQGLDIHTQTAAQLFDCQQREVTNEQRQLGKRINFSIMYGITPYGLSQDLGISATQAKEYIEKYFKQYPKVRLWMDTVIQGALETGYIETLYGRRRYIPELKEKNRNILEAGKRIAVNSVVQGTQAELMKMAMIRLFHLLEKKELDAALLLQIHDEIVLEVHNDVLKDVEALVHQTLEQIVAWNVPLAVSVRTGKTWASISK